MLHLELNWEMALEHAECQILGVWTTIFGAWTTIVTTCLMTTCLGKGHAATHPLWCAMSWLKAKRVRTADCAVIGVVGDSDSLRLVLAFDGGLDCRQWDQRRPKTSAEQRH